MSFWSSQYFDGVVTFTLLRSHLKICSFQFTTTQIFKMMSQHLNSGSVRLLGYQTKERRQSFFKIQILLGYVAFILYIKIRNSDTFFKKLGLPCAPSPITPRGKKLENRICREQWQTSPKSAIVTDELKIIIKRLRKTV